VHIGRHAGGGRLCAGGTRGSASSGSLSGGSRGLGGGFGTTSSARGSAGSSYGRSIGRNGLAGGEEAGNASLLALGVRRGRSRGAVALVALHGALGGVDDLGGVGVGSTDARGLSVDISSGARSDAGLGGGEAADDAGRGGDGGGGLGMGERAGEEGRQDDGGVLHFGCSSGVLRGVEKEARLLLSRLVAWNAELIERVW